MAEVWEYCRLIESDFSFSVELLTMDGVIVIFSIEQPNSPQEMRRVSSLRDNVVARLGRLGWECIRFPVGVHPTMTYVFKRKGGDFSQHLVNGKLEL